jgi:hypothetical protein
MMALCRCSAAVEQAASDAMPTIIVNEGLISGACHWKLNVRKGAKAAAMNVGKSLPSMGDARPSRFR